MAIITLHDLLNGECPKSENDLVLISDKICELGSLAEIREKVTPEVVVIFVGMNTIGAWKGDGWGGILENLEQLPHISQAMKELGLPEIGEAFVAVMAIFPPFVVYANDEAYFDALIFLSNPRFAVSDKRLNQYSSDERKQMSKAFNERLNILDELSEPLWGYNASDVEGWGSALGYIKEQADIPG